MKEITFLVGGTKFSGAEKRMIKTAALIARNSSDYKVNLYLRRTLFDQVGHGVAGSEIAKDMESLSEIFIINDSFLGYKSSARYFLSLLALLFQPKKFLNKIFHVALFSPFHFPLMFFSKKIFFEVTSPDISRSRYFSLMMKAYATKLHLIAVSDSVYNDVVAKFYNDSPNTGIPIGKRNIAFSEARISNEKEISSKQNYIVFAHRLIGRKNPVLAAKSFSALASKYRSWTFYIYGDGPLSGEVKKICEAADKNLIYMGYSQDLPCILKKSKIFISIIEPDSYPSQSVIEAMAFGNAIVIGNCGSGPEKFISDNGYAVELDERSVFSAIEKMILDPERLSDYCLSSVKLVTEKFSLGKYYLDSVRFYENDG